MEYLWSASWNKMTNSYHSLEGMLEIGLWIPRKLMFTTCQNDIIRLPKSSKSQVKPLRYTINSPSEVATKTVKTCTSIYIPDTKLSVWLQRGIHENLREVHKIMYVINNGGEDILLRVFWRHTNGCTVFFKSEGSCLIHSQLYWDHT